VSNFHVFSNIDLVVDYDVFVESAFKNGY